SFDVYVSDDGGPFTAFLTDTTQTSATFTGLAGHTYGFYSVATDRAGNSQATSGSAQATTLVPFASSITLASDHSGGGTYGQAVTITATVSATSGTPAGSVQFVGDGTPVGTPVTPTGGTARIPLPSLTAGSHS